MEQNNRRHDDARLTVLVDRVARIEEGLAKNTAITEQVADVLASFRVMAALAKWCAAIGTGALAVWHGWQAAIK
jgi:hypothetical protein